MISEEILAQIVVDVKQVSYGGKTEQVRRWAKLLGVSYNMVYESIRKVCPSTRHKRTDTGKRMNPNVNDWTRTIWGIKLRPPGEAEPISTDQAVKLAVGWGCVPAEAGQLSASTYNRIARELEMNRSPGRFARFQAKYANLVHQIDGSTSKYLYVARKTSDNDRVLKLHRPAKKPYKNKPVPTRERLMVYGLVDDFSGQQISRYVAAEGESAVDGLSFLQYAWGQNDDSRLQFRGLPRMVYLDNGPLKKAIAVQDFFKRLDVKIVPRMPYNSKAGGKIERPWRTLFHRFELPFFAGNWEKFEILLSEFNRQLINYLLEYNAMPHRYQKDFSREQMWWNSINERGGVIDIPSQALATVYRREKRTVTGGYFSLDNTEYEVLGLNEGKVWVHEGIFDDRLVVQDVRSHARYEVKLFKPLSFGQRVEIVKTKAEKIAEESREKITIANTLYSEDAPSNVKKLPVRKKEERELEDPLSVDNLQEEEEKLFGSERERYEWLLQHDLGGEEIQASDREFMRHFETTDMYRQLAGTYKRWKTFWMDRVATI